MGVPKKYASRKPQRTFVVGLSAVALTTLKQTSTLSGVEVRSSNKALIPNAKFQNTYHKNESVVCKSEQRIFCTIRFYTTFTRMQVPFSIALLEQKDTIPLFELIQANAKRLHQYFPITARKNCSLIATEYYIQKKIHEAKAKEGYTFKIVATDSQLPIGLFIIKKINWQTKECELAYFIDASYEGKGITTAAISLLIAYCKEELQLKKAILRIGEDNPGSLRIAEKHNFTFIKREKGGHKDFHGNIMDVLHFECILKINISFYTSSNLKP